MKAFLTVVAPGLAGATLGMAIATSSLAGDQLSSAATPVEGPSADGPPSNIQAPQRHTNADSSDQINTCYWVSDLEPFDASMEIECETGARVVSGGCLSDAAGVMVEQSFAFEGNAGGALNFPDLNEAWYNTESLSGWRCDFTAEAGSGNNNYVYALCCGN